MAQYEISKELLPATFKYPKEFLRLVGQGIVTFEPWYLPDSDEAQLYLSHLRSKHESLIPFARKGDSESLACWDLELGAQVVLYDFEFPDKRFRGQPMGFWDWFRKALDDFIWFET